MAGPWVKTARVQFRVTPDMKRRIEGVAQKLGTHLSDLFVVSVLALDRDCGTSVAFLRKKASVIESECVRGGE